MDNRNSHPVQPPSALPSTLVSLLLLLAVWGSAWTEQASAAETPSVQKVPGAEFAPRGQRMAKEIKYGDWRKVCFKTPGANKVCRTTISGTWETGQSAVRTDLIEREGEGTARLQLFLPVGLYLQAGVKVRADDGPQYRIPYVWCLTNTCIAADLADPNLIRDMETGKKLQIEVVDSSVLTVSTTLPLDKFATVRKSAPAPIFEQDVDE